MACFLLNQDFPFLSPSKMSIYEVKVLKLKSAQLFTAIGAKKISKIYVRKQNHFIWKLIFWEKLKSIFLVYSIKDLFSTGKKPFSRTIWTPKIFISMKFLIEVHLEALEDFKNFQTSIPFTRNLNFWSISIGSDFSKSETVVGHILQSAWLAASQRSGRCSSLNETSLCCKS